MRSGNFQHTVVSVFSYSIYWFSQNLINVAICHFSRFGAQQLSFDFNHFLTWFEQEEMELSLDTITEIHTLPSVNQMKNAIMLLACQPEGRKGYRGTEDGNLLANYHGGSSSSTISQVSIGKWNHDVLFVLKSNNCRSPSVSISVSF